MTSRQTALSLLLSCERSKQFSNIALDHTLEKSKLSQEDRALASALFYGVTERKITLDHYAEALSSRPLSKIDDEVKAILRLGLYQLIYMDKIPPHAALNETVALCKRSYSGFVNAILRSYTRLSAPIELPEKNTEPVKYISVAYSVCEELAKKLLSDFGLERTEKILESSFNTPRTTLRVNTLKITRDELASKLNGAELSNLSCTAIKITGALRNTYGFDDGLFFVQDEASQIAVNALGARPGEFLIDTCSCPGSKSFGAAINMQNKGRVLSLDLHQNKLSLVESGAKRLGISIIETRQGDGRVFIPELEEKADKLLCDVPCSGFGVLSKKPELRYKDPSESEKLPDIQLAILENSSRYLKKGGTLVYSTCTIFPEENKKNVERFLEKHPEFTPAPFAVGDLNAEDGMLSLFGDTHGTDGFFIAKMIKN